MGVEKAGRQEVELEWMKKKMENSTIKIRNSLKGHERLFSFSLLLLFAIFQFNKIIEA